MTDTATTHDDGDGEHAHATPHLPPPSFAPINAALALAMTLTGFLTDIRNVVGPLMWGIGLIYLIASGYFWVRGARNEYLELPEDGGH
ncbi:MAG TPA: hypothetical protein VND88_14490 [Candidatus Acidoferrales bacterium]|nr:hypothetical protein [Candidatus Acidoferrales bacterium]